MTSPENGRTMGRRPHLRPPSRSRACVDDSASRGLVVLGNLAEGLSAQPDDPLVRVGDLPRRGDHCVGEFLLPTLQGSLEILKVPV